MPFGQPWLAGPGSCFGGLASVLSGAQAGKPVFARQIDPAAHRSGHAPFVKIESNQIAINQVSS
jgi:hypothetical protein